MVRARHSCAASDKMRRGCKCSATRLYINLRGRRGRVQRSSPGSLLTGRYAQATRPLFRRSRAGIRSFRELHSAPSRAYRCAIVCSGISRIRPTPQEPRCGAVRRFNPVRACSSTTPTLQEAAVLLASPVKEKHTTAPPGAAQRLLTLSAWTPQSAQIHPGPGPSACLRTPRSPALCPRSSGHCAVHLTLRRKGVPWSLALAANSPRVAGYEPGRDLLLPASDSHFLAFMRPS